MNVRAYNTLSGSEGFAAQVWAAGIIQSQLAFAVNRALNTRTEEGKEEPVYDANMDDELSKSFGDNGQTKPQKIDLPTAINAHAAAYTLFRILLNTPDPETGRKHSHWGRYLKTLPQAVLERVQANGARNMELQAEAAAKKYGVSFDARKKALEEEITANATRLADEVKGPWMDAVRTFTSDSTYDIDTLAEMVLDGCESVHMDAADQLNRAADALQKRGAERLAQGKFADMDTSIWAWTSAALKVKQAE